jgi:hypothetical protein
VCADPEARTPLGTTCNNLSKKRKTTSTKIEDDFKKMEDDLKKNERRPQIK